MAIPIVIDDDIKNKFLNQNNVFKFVDFGFLDWMYRKKDIWELLNNTFISETFIKEDRISMSFLFNFDIFYFDSKKLSQLYVDFLLRRIM